MNETLNIALAIALPLALLAAGYGWPVWQASITPASDIPRLKRSLEGPGRRVVQVTRAGTDWEIHRRGATSFRRYAVVIEMPDHSHVRRMLALEPGLLGDDQLYEIRNGVRCSLLDDI